MTYFNLQKEIKRLGNIIKVPSEKYPSMKQSKDAHPYVEMHGRQFYFVIKERGTVYTKKEFNTMEELLFEVFDNITFSMAMDYELKHRIDGQDCRRLIFEHQLELMSKLNIRWKDKLQRKHNAILLEHPYNDIYYIKK